VSPVTFNPPSASALPPGLSTVTATASDLSGAVVSCSFTVQRPFLSINGFYPPLGPVTMPGSCTVPALTNNAGSRVVIKFDALLCNSPYVSPTPPTVTIKKLGIPGNPCGVASIVSGPFILGTASQWHFNWDSAKKDAGAVFRIEVNQGDMNPNPPGMYIRLQ
jgi:hypothetical protein